MINDGIPLSNYQVVTNVINFPVMFVYSQTLNEYIVLTYYNKLTLEFSIANFSDCNAADLKRYNMYYESIFF